MYKRQKDIPAALRNSSVAMVGELLRPETQWLEHEKSATYPIGDTNICGMPSLRARTAAGATQSGPQYIYNCDGDAQPRSSYPKG